MPSVKLSNPRWFETATGAKLFEVTKANDRGGIRQPLGQREFSPPKPKKRKHGGVKTPKMGVGRGGEGWGGVGRAGSRVEDKHW